MARKPKGSIIQPIPSWNIKQMAGSSLGSGPVNFGDIHAVGLLNTSSRGEWLVVWDVQVNVRPNLAAQTIFLVDFADHARAKPARRSASNRTFRSRPRAARCRRGFGRRAGQRNRADFL